MTYPFRSVTILALLLLTSLLAACGFHLRGAMSTGGEIRQLSVTGNDPVYQRYLSRAMERSGINISDQTAPWQINIVNVEREVDQQTVASAGYFEQRIAMNVVYQLQTSSGLPLFSPVQLSRERYITQNQDAPNAAESEQSIILAELQQELIATTLRRIHNLSEAELSEEAQRARDALKVQMENSEPNRNTQP
ncbi:hypothetical protein [Endozoicomonas sp. SCSIO W0465]|uniref:LPS-assembly lipoprotein LptE n=1 Tax=Endozoicomonas sp. SCSIO W0465 TaxID=2918516 RepID=UPI002074C498|nr:hypothetical protein [Endozoicomonas sp. SCSIO W0465]USE37881.1 hypothetical protein MJO57_06725 [Endozoicomonas sp. SCSIO W0465]